MSLAEKMFIPGGTLVPCVNLPADVDLGDINPWAVNFEGAAGLVAEGKSPSLFVFVETANELDALLPKLEELWSKKLTFWLFYPKKPHLNTDLGRDKTFEILKKVGLQGSRQVGVDQLWSCLYYKAK